MQLAMVPRDGQTFQLPEVSSFPRIELCCFYFNVLNYIYIRKLAVLVLIGQEYFTNSDLKAMILVKFKQDRLIEMFPRQ